ncbi:MAG: 6,7-dimethyl-8-ribityllumazine synthase [Alphaproteobacteria bacterium]|nr:6,7-dimethyl-8-ribityllumazine synthase [Alphaproteobacteria bacterium]
MAKRLSVLIVEARYYAHVSDALLKGAEAALDDADVRYDCVTVTGAFEIPAAIALAARTRKYDGYIALGCVIRGETSHYDLVCGECARGIQDLALAGHAIGFGVLTVENVDQAFKRARIDEKNKGGEAVRACLAMIALRRSLKARR